MNRENRWQNEKYLECAKRCEDDTKRFIQSELLWIYARSRTAPVKLAVLRLLQKYED
jgi:hypothetical protein